MLALRTKIASYAMAGAMVFSTAFQVASASAQTPPSQRYRPVVQDTAPPSVHVPPSNLRAIGSAGYNLSDQSLSQRPDKYSYHRGSVQQTSYQSPAEPQVPAILKDTARATAPASPAMPAASSSTQTAMPRIQSDSISPTIKTKSPADFANAMNQVRGASPRIAPEELNSVNAAKVRIEQQMAELRDRALAKADASPRIANAGNGLRNDASPAVTPISSELPASKVSATELVRSITAQSAAAGSTVAAPVQDRITSPGNSKFAVHESEISESESGNIRQVSSETYVNEDSDASIRLDAPALSVETFGPQTIGINKPATYQVKVHNSSHTDAERILVGVKFPAWVDIDNVNMTAGNKEITDGSERARVVWNVDRIPAKGSQTITVTAIPRQAEVFDVGVEWTLVPRVGKANVQVTEPRLEMNISGPAEVQFGEKALYHVTVRNPGTGTAENVGVMLPEALGGERASLGNIEPGKEKNFQVELLARTAGDLALVATANAEGGLTTSADRKLVVRKANLGIALQGPALKYAGSPARYKVTLTNTGDAVASDVMTAFVLPAGVKYIGGIDSVQMMDGGMNWKVGSIDPGESKTYQVNCLLNAAGDLQLEVGARDGKATLAASSACLTTVETVADLVLSVADPKGPLPTGEEVMYTINVRNRGSRSARGVNLVMQFSEGIEPHKVAGQDHRIVPGQVLFSPISQIDPGQELSFKVNAEAFRSGTHVFRAQLTCEDSDAREIAEGTTRFFGDDIEQPATATANAQSDFGSEAGSNDFTR
jgi:uncharacterized repeat protein (TIGR01451 family)